jgi:hypothetical protein
MQNTYTNLENRVSFRSKSLCIYKTYDSMKYLLITSMRLMMILSACVTLFEVKKENDVNKLVLM